MTDAGDSKKAERKRAKENIFPHNVQKYQSIAVFPIVLTTFGRNKTGIMEYDFDEVIQRRGTDSVKWDRLPEALPLWVADMDFKAAPSIIDAIRRKTEQGVFGYSLVPESYFDAVRWWLSHRHGLEIEREWIVPIGGLVPAATASIMAAASPGDEVIVQTPAYNCFFNNVRNAGCKLSENKLIYKDRRWQIDFPDFERRARTAKVFLLCNPHNPVGRLWTEEELERMGDICLKYGVEVISDEIHIDIVPPGSECTPFARVRPEFLQNCIFFNSPTKCFNIAGLHISNMICADPQMRKALVEASARINHTDINQMGLAALQGAFCPEGEEWLEQANAYIHRNYLLLKERFERELPELDVSPLEATYLVWVDCRKLTVPSAEAQKILIEKEKVWINAGDIYGLPGFFRINIACPRQILEEGLDRIIRGFGALL